MVELAPTLDALSTEFIQASLQQREQEHANEKEQQRRTQALIGVGIIAGCAGMVALKPRMTMTAHLKSDEICLCPHRTAIRS